MCFGRGKKEVYAIFSDEFIRKSILKSIGMNDTQIFCDRFYLKLNLKKSLLCKLNISHPTSKLMLSAPSNEIL